MGKALSNLDELLKHTVTCLIQSNTVYSFFRILTFIKGVHRKRSGLLIFGGKINPHRLAGKHVNQPILYR